ncbi:MULTISPECIES: response regulator transcription factor [Bacillota]|uniref:response regulator transcription factor n=1 Tax=Bacillota TaxID=1239 RepID=UPI000AD0C4A1|nr:response regulator transcription factor [Blautia coccoides]ASU30390.1 DNA-binding response regulator [Blautia pseudococcoides]
MNEKILVVDDEKGLADLVEVYLKNDGYTVYKFYNGTDTLRCIESTHLDLAILDIMLPDIDGFQICQKIREKFYFPVIMLTAKVEDGDKIMGLSVADDYITKPFNPLEVVARVKAQLRQYMRYRQPQIKQEDECSEYDIRGMTISKKSHKCILFGKELQLTPTEFSILWYLCENQGKVVSTEELFEVVWGEKTVWGVGYTIEILDKTREEIVEIQAALW